MEMYTKYLNRILISSNTKDSYLQLKHTRFQKLEKLKAKSELQKKESE